MVKRIILVLVIMCSFSGVCMAENTTYPVIIQNGTPQEVSDMIVQLIALRTQGKASITASTPNSLTLMAVVQTRQGLLQIPYDVEHYLSFTFVKTANGTILNASQTARPTGSSSLIAINSRETELILKTIKGLLDGQYMFGFECEKKKHNGGYKLTKITTDGAFDKAGFQVGDILIKIDNVSVKGGYYDFCASDKYHIDSLKEQNMSFTVKRNDVEITKNVVSLFQNAEQVRNSVLIPR